MKVDATALFVKTTSDVFRNNGVVYKNNAVASTLFANKNEFPAQRRKFGSVSGWWAD
ncbi:MAG: hypothetical protein IJV06_05780 [Bacteroidaceae bacterium]|nr:hypothetical protein [Bacteroidaceae bacterium]